MTVFVWLFSDFGFTASSVHEMAKKITDTRMMAEMIFFIGVKFSYYLDLTIFYSLCLEAYEYNS